MSIPCLTVSSLHIETGVAGNLLIDLAEIKGNLTIAENASVTALLSAAIATIGGTFNVVGVPELRSIDIPGLKDCGGLRISHAPSLGTVRIGHGDPGSSAGIVQVDDTGIQEFQLEIRNVDSLAVTHNQRLSFFNSTIEDVAGEALFQDNGNDISINLDDLLRAVTLRIHDTKNVRLPSLDTVGDLFFANNSFDSLSLPKLKLVMTDLSITGNDDLSELDAPSLNRIGDSLAVLDNPVLVELHGFPDLEEVGIQADLNGTFKSYVFAVSTINLSFERRTDVM